MIEANLDNNTHEKLRAAQAKSLEDWQSEVRYFIPLRASVSPFRRDDCALDDDIERFLVSDKKVMLLLGDAGSGKSVYTLGLAARKWKLYQPNSIIPLWISLSSLKNPIENAIEEVLQKAGCSGAEIETLRQKNQFLIIFDGYDEIRQNMNLYVTNRLENWQAKIIITCRREYLYPTDDYAMHFMPFVKEHALHAAYTERMIKPFNAEQINQYIQQEFTQGTSTWKDSQYFHAEINKIPGLKELISSPFILKICIAVLPTIIKRYEKMGDAAIQMTQTAILDALIEQWFERQQIKLRLTRALPSPEDNKAAFWCYSKVLAQAMHNAKITVMQYESAESMFDDEDINPWTKFFSSDNKQVSLLKTACLLREISPQRYAFIHDSLIPYFISRELYEEIHISGLGDSENSISQTIIPATPPEKPSDEHGYFNRHLMVQDNETIQFSADKITEGDLGTALKNRYLSLIYSSKNNPAMSVAAANSLTILNRARISFSGMNFQAIHCPGAEVEGGIFHHTDLRHANLKGVNIRKAYLANTKFQHADTTGMQFGQFPSLKFNWAVQSLAYSPNGEWLAIALSGSAIKIFNTYDLGLATQCNLQGDNASPVSCIVFSSDSHLIISGHQDGKLRIWNTKSGNLIRTLVGHEAEITCMAYHNESERLLSGSADNNLRQWNCTTWECQTVSKGHAEKVTAAVFHPNGNCFVSSSTDKTLRLWSSDTGKLMTTWDPEYKLINGLAFNTRDGQLATCGLDERGEGMIKLWMVTADSFTLVRKLQRPNEPYCLVYSPDGMHILVGSFGFIEQFSVETGTLMYAYQGQLERKPTTLAYNVEGSIICAGSNIGTRVCQWPVINSLETDLAANQIQIYRVKFNSTGTEFASDGWDGKLQRWNSETGALISIHPCAKELWNIVYSPDRQRIALCGSKGKIEVINFISGKRELFIQEIDHIITSTSYPEHDGEQNTIIQCAGILGEIVGMAFSSDGLRLAVGAQNNLIQFSSTTGEVLMISEGHRNIIYEVAYYQDNQRLISGSIDKTFRVWDAVSGKLIREIEAHKIALSSIALSPDHLRLASCGSDMRVREWDLQSGKLVFTLNCKEGVATVAYHPTKKWLYAACWDGSIYIWDTSQEAQPLRLARIQDFQKTTCISVNSRGDILSAGVGSAINYWQCDLSLEMPRWLLKWSTKQSQSLVMRGSHFKKTKGLNDKNQLLLSQLGARGVNPKQQGSMGITSLHEAVFEDDLELFEALLSQDVNASAKDEDGFSPLCIAVTYGRLEMVAILLRYDVNLLASEPDGTYLLHRAVDSGYVEVARLLLTHGADVDAQNSLGLTPLHIASFKGEKECIDLLLSNGAKTNITSGLGLTILHNAVKSGEPSCLELLASHCKELINDKDKVGFTPLHFSVVKGLEHNVPVEILFAHSSNVYTNDKKQAGNRMIIEILLAHGANPDAQDDEGLTPLHWAAFHGFHSAIEALLKGGADSRIISHGGLSALHNATKSGNPHCIRLLLSLGNEQINVKTQHGFTPLHFAVDKGQGHKEIVEILLSQGANPDVQDNEGLTPLHWATFYGLHDAVEALLEGGADSDVPSHGGLTPLHNAAKSGDSHCVKLLLARNTQQLNAKTQEGCTPLQLAVDLRHFHIVRILLDNGADIYAQDNGGATVLHYAAVKGSVELFEILLKSGVNVSITNSSGWTILHCVIQSANSSCLEYLLTRCPALINVKTQGGEWSALHIAVNFKSKTMIEQLFTHGAMIDDRDFEGRTPLYWAADGGNSEIVQILIELGAKIDIENNAGLKPLHCAALLYPEIVKILLPLRREDIHAKTKNGQTPLHIAAEKGQTETVIFFVEQRADIEARDNNGWTPLHHACHAGHIDTIKFLLSNRANVNTQSHDGQTPLHLAAKNGLTEVVDLLLIHSVDIDTQNANGDTALLLAIWHQHYEVVELLLLHKASIKVENNEGCTPINLACVKGNIKIAVLLVKYGDDIHKKNKYGTTLLHIAAYFGHDQFIREYLLYQDLESTNSSGRKTLHIAADRGHENIVRLFLENNAVVNVQDTEFGHTPLHKAAQNGHSDTVKILIEHGADPKTRSKAGFTALDLANQAGHQPIVTFLENINQQVNRAPSPSSPQTDFFRIANDTHGDEELDINNEKSADSMDLPPK